MPWLRNVRVKHFEDNAQVKSAILASACIVPPPLYLPGHGYAIDGAFSDFQIIKVMHDSKFLPFFVAATCSVERLSQAPSCKHVLHLILAKTMRPSTACLHRLSLRVGIF